MWLNRNACRYRVRNEAVLMRQMVNLADHFGIRCRRRETHGWTEDYARDLQLSVRALLEKAHGVVFISVDGQAFARGEGEEGQHVTGRECTHELFFGIDTFAVAFVFGCCAARKRDRRVLELQRVRTVIAVV